MMTFVSLLAVLMMSLPAIAAEEPIVIRFSHVVAADAPKGQGAEKFAQLAAQRTQGRVQVVVYPNSRLYGDRDEMAALQSGQVEMLAPSLSKIKVLRQADFEVFDLPYLFPDIEAVHRVTQGSIGRSLLERLSEHGVVGLAFWDNGFKQMSANRPLRLPRDAVDLKLRIQPSRILEAQVRALGAQPRPIEFSEVYTSLKVGTVDGTENPPSNFYTQGMHRAQKYLTLSNHGYLGYVVLANKKFWNGLPADIRGALEEALREATAYVNAYAQRDNAAALEAVRQSGRTEVIELSAEERAAWRQALAPVHAEAKARISPELIERIYQETGYTPGG